jgi:hypothetical protein
MVLPENLPVYEMRWKNMVDPITPQITKQSGAAEV